MLGWLIKHKTVGEQIDDEAEWMRDDLHELVQDADGIIVVSNPPSGKTKVVNIYFDSETSEQVAEY